MKITKEPHHVAIGNKAWTNNWTKDGRQFYSEIRDDSTMEVWLCQAPMTRQEYRQLSLPEGFSRVGIGRAAHDLSFFRRSPEAQEDGPLATMQVGDWTYAKVARPGGLDKKYAKQGFRNLVLLDVYKYHKVVFLAGRTIEILTMEDGLDYVPNVSEAIGLAGSSITQDRPIPPDWSMREVTLKEDLILEIPCPSRVCFFSNGDGFHGPVKILNTNARIN